MNNTEIEIFKPYSNESISTYMILFRWNDSWGLLKNDEGDISIPVYPCQPGSTENDIENSMMVEVFRASGVFEFETKPIFDYTCDNGGKKTFGRIYIVALYGTPSDRTLSFLKTEEMPEKEEGSDFVRELLMSADITAKLYF